MLTVKVMSPDGGEEIHSGLSVGFNPNQQSIAVSGMDQNAFPEAGRGCLCDERKRQDHFPLRTQGPAVGITEAPELGASIMLNRKIGLKPDKNPVEEIPKLRVLNSQPMTDCSHVAGVFSTG